MQSGNSHPQCTGRQYDSDASGNGRWLGSISNNTVSTALQSRWLDENTKRSCCSSQHWIDNGAAFASARSRSLGDSIRRIGQSREWRGIGAWSEVLTELYKHLEYMPKGAEPKPRTSSHGNDPGNQGGYTFTWQDVFSHDYGLPVHSFISSLPVGMDPQIGGLKSLLLRWLGIDEAIPLEGSGPRADEPATLLTDGSSQEDPTDRIEGPPLQKPSQRPPVPASDTERESARSSLLS